MHLMRKHVARGSSRRVSSDRRGKANLDAASAASESFVVDSVALGAPGHWLAAGLRDIAASRYSSLFYGVCFVALGLGIEAAHAANWRLTVGITAGFLFLGPFLAVGVYELSRQVQRGERIEPLLSLFSWCRNPRGIGFFATGLSLLLLVWLWESLTLMNQIPETTTESPEALDIVGTGMAQNLMLLMWSVIWLMFALIVYVYSVVSIPMLLDKPVSATTAVWLSVKCCLINPLPMLIWALCIVTIIGSSLLSGYWPLIITGPWIGHATWHAYKDCIRESSVSVD